MGAFENHDPTVAYDVHILCLEEKMVVMAGHNHLSGCQYAESS